MHSEVASKTTLPRRAPPLCTEKYLLQKLLSITKKNCKKMQRGGQDPFPQLGRLVAWFLPMVDTFLPQGRVNFVSRCQPTKPIFRPLTPSVSGCVVLPKRRGGPKEA